MPYTHEQAKDIGSDPDVATLQYTVKCSNFYFRTLREHGVFVPDDVRLLVSAAGQAMVASYIP